MSQLDTRIPLQVPNVLAQGAQVQRTNALAAQSLGSGFDSIQQGMEAPIRRNALAAQAQGAELQNLQAEQAMLGGVLEDVAANPGAWGQAREYLVQNGVFEAGELPEQLTQEAFEELSVIASVPAEALTDQDKLMALIDPSRRAQAAEVQLGIRTPAGSDKGTTSMREYDLARQQGFQGTFADWKKETKAGTTVNVGDSNIKLTEGQSKDLGYYTRGLYALDDLEGMDEQLTSIDESFMSNFGTIGNLYASPEFRQAKVAADQFLSVILRKDTGAAITSEEFELYGPQFLPMPGDDAGTIEQKRKARTRALSAIRLGLGTATPLADKVDAEFRSQKPIEAWSTEELEAEAARLRGQ